MGRMGIVGGVLAVVVMAGASAYLARERIWPETAAPNSPHGPAHASHGSGPIRAEDMLTLSGGHGNAVIQRLPAREELPPGTMRMAQRLELMARNANPESNGFASAERIVYFGEKLKQPHPLAEQIELQFQYALELLRGGRVEESTVEFDKVRQFGAEHPELMKPDFEDTLTEQEALAHLRMGEIENCIGLHGVDSCLMPIKGDGIHSITRGSHRAMEIYLAALKTKPDDLRYRWLLNIAAMTLGEWPDKVPSQWVIPPEALRNDAEFTRFYNVAPRLGLAVLGMAGGAVMDDFDNDGFLDILASKWGSRDPLHFFHNNGDGTFVEMADSAGLTGIVGGLNMIQGDYNNDGFVDVFITRGSWLGPEGRQPQSLLRNNGDNTLDDVTEKAGIVGMHPTPSGVWADFDNDGWLDLYLAHESGPESTNPCELFRNNRDGTFTECALAAGVAVTIFAKGAVAGDYDNDGLQDLYVTNLTGATVLYHNNGPAHDPAAPAPSKDAAAPWITFTDVTAKAGIVVPLQSFPAWWFDYDNDGWLDLWVAGYHEKDVGAQAAEYLHLPSDATPMALYHNNRDGTFTDTSVAMGLGISTMPMGVNFGDLDNDGWLDFYLGTGTPSLNSVMPNRMFRSDGGNRFLEVTFSGDFGHLQKGHAVEFGDIDNDGDQDIYQVMGGAFTGDIAYNTLFENPGHGNHWITLKLQGVRTNRSAIGARIRINVASPSAPGGVRDIHNVVSSGGSFGCNSLQQEIGLGDATAINEIEIKWPASGITHSFKNVAMDHAYSLREDAPALTPLELRRLDLSPAGQAPKHDDAAHDHSKHHHR